jgi:hypothetical protein
MEDLQVVYLCCSKLSKYKSFHDAVVKASQIPTSLTIFVLFTLEHLPLILL